MDTKIVITGASGFVAKNLRKYLAGENIKLVSISKSNYKLYKNETKISLKKDDSIILKKIKDADAIVHLAGIGRESVENSYNTVNVEFTRRIVNLSKKAKIRKIIYTSGLGVCANTSIGYFISKYKAEQIIVNSGLDYTIFRPSYIVGKDDHLTKYLKKQIKRKKIQIPGSGRYTIQPIHIDDVVKIITNSIMQTKFKNKTLDLVGAKRMTFRQYVKLYSKNVTIENINLEDAYYNAINNPKSEFGVDDLNILIGNFVGDYKKLYKITGIKLKSVV